MHISSFSFRCLFHVCHRTLRFCGTFLVFFTTLHSNAQLTHANDLPDAPVPDRQTSKCFPSARDSQKDCAGVAPGTWGPLKPQTASQKFVAATQNNFSYVSLVATAAGAGISLGLDYYPEFGQGGVGYSRYLWHNFADGTVDTYMTQFILPVALHQDTRYYRLGHGSVWKRSAYSLREMVITRSDQGTEEFNTSEILGSAAAASLSSAYYPERDRTLNMVMQRWGGNLLGDELGLLLKEFSPDIGSALGNVVPMPKRWRRRLKDQNPCPVCATPSSENTLEPHRPER